MEKKNALKLKPSLKSYSSFDDSSNAKAHNRSLSNTSSISSLSSMKNVRFATNLTTVKNYDTAAEPISISHENSPTLRPVASVPSTTKEENVFYLSDYDDFTRHMDLKFLSGFQKNNRGISFFLDDDEIEDQDEDEDDGFIKGHELKKFFGNLYMNKPSNHTDCGDLLNRGVPNDDINNNNINNNGSLGTLLRAGHDYRNMPLLSNDDDSNNTTTHVPLCVTNPVAPFTNDLLTEMNWKLMFTNANSNKINLTSNDNNIQLVTLTPGPIAGDSIVGRIIVKNLSFEKFIEAKYTFNNWKDIHYSTAYFTKSISPEIDEFEFNINLNSLKYILQFKKILEFCSNTAYLNMELCCRYDVNGETYYDNNNYNNYCSTLMVSRVITAPLAAPESINNENKVVISGPEKKSTTNNTAFANNYTGSNKNTIAKDINKKTPASAPHRSSSSGSLTNSIFFGKSISRRRKISSRTFSENTDYYNTSPLKHLYHSDPTSWVKPKRLNEVLYDSSSSLTDNVDMPASIDSISHVMQEPLTEREHFISQFDYANLNDSMDTLTTVNLMNHSINNYESLNNNDDNAELTINESIERDISTLNLQDQTSTINDQFNDSVMEPPQSPINTILGDLEVNDDKQSVVTDTTLDIEALKLPNVSVSSPPVMALQSAVPVLDYYDCYSTANNSVETITKPLSDSPASLLTATNDTTNNNTNNSFEESLSNLYNIPLPNQYLDNVNGDVTRSYSSNSNDSVSNQKWNPVIDTDRAEDTRSSISSGSGTIIANSNHSSSNDHEMGTRDSITLPQETTTNGTDYQKFLNSSYFCRPSSSSSSVSTTDSSLSSNSIVTSNSGSLASVPSSINSSDTGSFVYQYSKNFNNTNNVYRIPSKSHPPNFSNYVFVKRDSDTIHDAISSSSCTTSNAIGKRSDYEIDADPRDSIVPALTPTLKVSETKQCLKL